MTGFVGHPGVPWWSEAARRRTPRRRWVWREATTEANLNVARNLFTYEDQCYADARTASIQLRRLVPAVPVERKIALSQFGQATFASLQRSAGNHRDVYCTIPRPRR